ncbi:MAG: hypothetical protein ACR2HJ_11460 [Fimbriimonadales bacterium]
MIWACIGTSSPVASVALFEDDAVLESDYRHAPTGASGAALEILQQMNVGLDEIDLFSADLGPGSFTGVKVGVVLAKTLAYCFKKPAAGFTSFDLISPEATAAVPSRKGSCLLRAPGQAPLEVSADDPRLASALGYGPAFGEQTYPLAENAARLFESINAVDPVVLVPNYVLEPSISKPKQPFGRAPE